MTPETPPARESFAWFTPVTTRWMDNDVYGHVNNAVYYAYFDTVANSYLIEKGALNIQHSETIGYVVHSQCHYLRPVVFPDSLDGGFCVNKLGNSSVEYGIGLFLKDQPEPAAYGTFTHVFVSRETERPVPIQGALREALIAAQVNRD